MIDAAVRDVNGTSYLIFGSKCYPFAADSITASNLDTISNRWSFLPSSFQTGVDAVLRQRGNKWYFFKGNLCYKQGADEPRPIQEIWTGLDDDFNNGIDAAVLHPDGKSYLFSGSRCAAFAGSSKSDPTIQEIGARWTGLPEQFTTGIDAAFTHRPRAGYQGRPYLISGEEYVRFPHNGYAMDVSQKNPYPHPLEGWWKDMESAAYEGSRRLSAHIVGGVAVVTEDGGTVSEDQLFSLPPGSGITLRCADPGVRVKELRIWEGAAKAGAPTHVLHPGDSTEIHDGEAGLRCTSPGVFLRHRHEVDDEAHYFFAVTFTKNGQDFPWDPEVQDEKGGPTGGLMRKPKPGGGGAGFVFTRARPRKEK